jgi:hypothetical protein
MESMAKLKVQQRNRPVLSMLRQHLLGRPPGRSFLKRQERGAAIASRFSPRIIVRQSCPSDMAMWLKQQPKNGSAFSTFDKPNSKGS